MLSSSVWRINQPNTILFVLVNESTVEITGLGDEWVLQISKAGQSFQPSAGVKAEVGGGWYSYTATVDEANTSGPVAIMINHPETVQQNLEYVVEDRIVSGIEFTYVLTSTAGNVPVPDAQIRIYSDPVASVLVWAGETDVFGVARDEYGFLPRLNPGTYYVFRDKQGFLFENPDVEVVS